MIMMIIISWVQPNAGPHFGGNFVWKAASQDFVSVRCPEQRGTIKYMQKSIGALVLAHLREFIRFSEGLLREVLL